MPGTYTRVKSWKSKENVTNEDLNAEFDNILTNSTPSGLDDYSTNVAQMQTTTDPGATGSESLATSLAGEIERLRFVIERIIGADATNWYDAPSASMSELDDALSLPPNRIVSGRVRSATDSFPIYLTPDGSSNDITLKAASTNLVFFINGTQYTATADISLTGLSQAPSTNNTALVNDANLADGDETRTVGEDGSTLTMDTVGSEISSRVGTFQAFKVNDGTNDDLFIAYIRSSTELTQCKRGYFFDSADAVIPRTPIANNDTITLLRAAYVFIKTDLTLTSTLNFPKASADEPTSPAVNDYWFDTVNEIWKTYNGSSFVDATATYVGVVVTDSSNTIGARSEYFFANHDELNTIIPEKDTNSIIRSVESDSRIKVNGIEHRYSPAVISWDMASHLDDGDAYNGSEQASTRYYFYIDDLGDVHISDVEPYNERDQSLGRYHPHHRWRYVCTAFNDSSSDLEDPVVNLVTTDGTNPGRSGFVKSASSGAFTTTSNTMVDVTNLEIKLSTTGNPVMLFLQHDGGGTRAEFGLDATSGAGSTQGEYQFLRNGSIISLVNQQGDTDLTFIPNTYGMPFFVDTPPPGENTYKIQVSTPGASTRTFRVQQCVIAAYELRL